MKRLITSSVFAIALAAGALVAMPANVCKADGVDLHQLLHGHQRCDHVISLLMRHGVNNDTPSTMGVAALHPHGPIEIAAGEMGDLELISVARHAAPAAGCGPAFDVVIKNCSTRDVCHSRLTLVGIFGRIRPFSPNTTVRIESLPAGQATQVTVTLPLESLAMGNLNGQVIGMNRLLVALDSFDQFMECNEANNLRLFELAAIPVAAVAEVTETVTTTETVASTAEVATQQTTVAVQTEATTAAPVAAPATAAPAADAEANAADPMELKSAIDQFNSESES